MKRWILLALLALLLWIVFTGRERFQDTNGIKGAYGLDGPDPSNPFVGSSAEHLIGLMPSSLLAALKNAKPKTSCPTTAEPTKQCKADHTTGTGAMTLIQGDINDIMGAFYLKVYQPKYAPSGISMADVDGFLSTYPMTSFLTANKEDVKALLVAYFVAQPHGAANTSSAAQIASGGAAAARGYDPMDIEDTMSGPLPAPIDERGGLGEPEGERPTYGPVFGENGPFSGRYGNGQGTGMNAAATLTGSSYAHPPPTEARLDPYDFWPGSSGSAGSAASLGGAKLPVNGPNWGGAGQAAASTSSNSSSQPAPSLYGPDPTIKPAAGNSSNTTQLPDHASAGSDPSNRYVGTSRVPGDQDLFPTSYMQSSAYSLANDSQKTDPVPFLTDFSVFQS